MDTDDVIQVLKSRKEPPSTLQKEVPVKKKGGKSTPQESNGKPKGRIFL